jgi:hypothetical protein
VRKVRKRSTKVGALILALLLTAGAALATGAVIQSEGLRITVLSQVQPFRLPRAGTAPIAVFVAGHVASADGGIPPQLERLTVKVNRRGLLQSKGLPVCQISQVQPATTKRALETCGDAVIGSGQFWAHIILPEQTPYPTRGRLLIFNGRQNGHPVLLTHIFTTNPFATSFVIVFSIHHLSHGVYGTELSASLPEALGTWGYLDRIKLTLRRIYRYQGVRRSYFNAGCPAPGKTRLTSFPLAYATFDFAGARELSTTVTKTCGVKE